MGFAEAHDTFAHGFYRTLRMIFATWAQDLGCVSNHGTTLVQPVRAATSFLGLAVYCVSCLLYVTRCWSFILVK